MKKFILSAFIALSALLSAQAQSPAEMMQQVPKAPVDTGLRMGTLPNGLTYYIRHNENPKGLGYFYIAQNVGSVLEEDNQRGLAHFLEHMAFNGSKHFPAGSLVSWCEKNGIKFGNDLNASTGTDRTVYNVASVPTSRQSMQDSVLYILYDWADGLTLDPVEIDKERGVIHEEWRQSNTGEMRVLTELLPKMYPGSRYGERLPIGTMEVVDNFPPQALRDYYEKWYRPDNQAIIVVGDIDVPYIEGKIKEIFSPIKMPENPAKREQFAVPDTPGTIYAQGKDKEITAAQAQLFFKMDPMIPKEMRNTQAYFPIKYMQRLIPMMLNARLDEISQRPDAPFAGAGVSFGNYFLSPTKEALSLGITAKDGDVRKGIAAAYREVKRAVQHGFTVGEYERARAEYLSRLEKEANNEAKRRSDAWVWQYVNNFSDNTPLSSPKDEYTFVSQIAPMLPIEAVNMILPQVVTDSNRVMLTLVPDNEANYLPTDEEMAAVIAAVDAETLEPYADQVKAEPLIPVLPKPGKVKKEKKDALFGATELTLSNGIKVYVLPTKYEDNQIQFRAVANGGGVQELPDDMANEIISLGTFDDGAKGLGDYTALDLKKYTQGKQVSIDFEMGDTKRVMSGTTTIKDLPTLMELIYMNFTAPSYDAAEFEATQKNYAPILAQQENNPQYAFATRLLKRVYPSPARQMLTDTILLAADRQRLTDMVRQATANAADYDFVFVGNVDVPTLRPLLEQYVATLPTDTKTAIRGTVKPKEAFQARPGRDIYDFEQEMATPQTMAFIQVMAPMTYNTPNYVLAKAAGQILSQRLIKTVREDWGAVYSIFAGGALDDNDINNAAMMSQFPMKPEMRDSVLAFIEQEMNNMASNVTPEEVDKVKEYMAKELKANTEKNSFWTNNLASTLLDGTDIVTDRAAVIDALTPQQVQDYMKALMAAGNYRAVTMSPKPQPQAPAVVEEAVAEVEEEVAPTPEAAPAPAKVTPKKKKARKSRH